MRSFRQILHPARTVCRADSASKKRLLETIATLISQDQPSLAYELVLDKLTARENLGSTGLGGGIAIPHCRIDQCTRPIAALLTLREAIDFDAPDDVPVDLLFVLLVPGEAHQEHLNILADIARRLSDADFCRQLRAATDDRTLFELATRDRE